MNNRLLWPFVIITFEKKQQLIKNTMVIIEISCKLYLICVYVFVCVCVCVCRGFVRICVQQEQNHLSLNVY